MKYIVVTGGVVSGLGKGITISSIGRILKASGLRVTSIKIDPYLNVDAGTMSPFEHGEVFTLDDGGEVVARAYAREEHVGVAVLMREALRVVEHAVERLPLRLVDGLAGTERASA